MNLNSSPKSNWLKKAKKRKRYRKVYDIIFRARLKCARLKRFLDLNNSKQKQKMITRLLAYLFDRFEQAHVKQYNESITYKPYTIDEEWDEIYLVDNFRSFSDTGGFDSGLNADNGCGFYLKKVGDSWSKSDIEIDFKNWHGCTHILWLNK